MAWVIGVLLLRELHGHQAAQRQIGSAHDFSVRAVV